MLGRIEAGRHREGDGDQDSRGSKPRACRNNRNNYLGQHFVSFWVSAARRQRSLSSGVPRANLMVFLRFLLLFGRRKNLKKRQIWAARLGTDIYPGVMTQL